MRVDKDLKYLPTFVSYVLLIKPTTIDSKNVKSPKRIMLVGEFLRADSKQALYSQKVNKQSF